MKANLRTVLTGCVVGAWVAATAWAQGLVICNSCGREAKPGLTVCARCSAPLPVPKPKDEAVKTPPARVVDERAVSVARLAKEGVDGSLSQAREVEEKHPAVALSYYQNALSLMRLLEAAPLPAETSKAILSGCTRCSHAVVQGRVSCHTCKGTGKYQMDLGRVTQKGKGVLAGEGIPCPLCKGAGSFAGYRDIDLAGMDIQQGRQEFERRQMVKGDVRLGRALLPAGLEKLLDTRERALVMTGMPSPCGSCQFTGRQKCVACKGAGTVKCTYTGCKNGLVEEKKSTSKHLDDDKNDKCPKCGGLAVVPCGSCKGDASVVCTKCDGSGLAKRCNRCTGTGLMMCTKCKGAGEVKSGTCPECKGEKVGLCTTCRGEGALAR